MKNFGQFNYQWIYALMCSCNKCCLQLCFTWVGQHRVGGQGVTLNLVRKILKISKLILDGKCQSRFINVARIILLLNNLTFKHLPMATIFRDKRGTILKQRPEIKSQNLFWAPWKKFAEFAILMVTDFQCGLYLWFPGRWTMSRNTRLYYFQ